MKISVNELGQVTSLEDALFVANAAWLTNKVQIFYAADNPDINYDISYCNISFIRSDGVTLRNFMAELVDDDDGLHWDYSITENSGILNVAGQLQVSAQLVKATYEEDVITKREIVSSVTVASYVQKNIGITDEEEYDRVLDEVTIIRDELAGRINDNDNRIEVIEDANPMTDFVSSVSSGYGTKYYFDGTTATVPLATGSCVEVPDVIPLSQITFLAENWTDANGDGEYELAFGPTTTGRDSSNYIASVDILSGSGYEQSAMRIFKGSDGSILLSGVTEPFAGRVLMSGGVAQVNVIESDAPNDGKLYGRKNEAWSEAVDEEQLLDVVDGFWDYAVLLETGQDLNDFYGEDMPQFYRAITGTIALSLLNIPFTSSNGCTLDVRPIRQDKNFNSYDQMLYNTTTVAPYRTEMYHRAVFEDLNSSTVEYGNWEKIPATAYDLPYNDTTAGDAIDSINTQIGDISTALDTINGEVI